MGTKSAEKAARQALKRRARNKSLGSSIKTFVGKAEGLIAAAETEPAKEAVVAATSALDKAVTKGIIHRNTAARRKSRLMKKLNQASPAKPEES